MRDSPEELSRIFLYICFMMKQIYSFHTWFAAAFAGLFLLSACGEKDPQPEDPTPGPDKPKTSLTLTAETGWDIYVAGNDRDGGNYRYGPSIIVRKDGSIDAWFSANGEYFDGIYPVYDDFTTRDALHVASGDVGQAFTAAQPFWCISVCCPTWTKQGSECVTFSLYRWEKDYATTVASAPVSRKRFEKFDDNANLSLYVSPAAESDPSIKFEAGRYLLVLSDGTPDAGVWKYVKAARDTQLDSRLFIGGNPASGAIYAMVYTDRIHSENGLYWDAVSYRHSTDGGKTWGPETKTVCPTDGTLDELSCCDPGVACWGGYYYVGYTSTVDRRGSDNDVYVARGKTPTGPWEKWNGNGWGGDKVAPVVDYDANPDHYGAGEPCIVVVDDVIYFYYSWDEETMSTRVATASASDPNWPGSLVHRGTAIDKREVDRCDHSDVKYCDAIGKFIAINAAKRWTDSSYIELWISSDGLRFTRAGKVGGITAIRPKLHNVGISGDALGHFDPDKPQYISYAYGDVSCFWNTFFHPLTVTLK